MKYTEPKVPCSRAVHPTGHQAHSHRRRWKDLKWIKYWFLAFNFVIFQVFSTKHISAEQAKPELRLCSRWDITSRITTAFALSSPTGLYLSCLVWDFDHVAIGQVRRVTLGQNLGPTSRYFVLFWTCQFLNLSRYLATNCRPLVGKGESNLLGPPFTTL